MKATGYVRPVDELGRLVLPVSVRNELRIEPKDGVEIYVDGEDIIMQKYLAHCTFCDAQHNLTTFKGKQVCPACARGLSDLSHPAAD